MKYFFSRFGIGLVFLAFMAGLVYTIILFFKFIIVGLALLGIILFAFLIGDGYLGDNPSTTKGYPR